MIINQNNIFNLIYAEKYENPFEKVDNSSQIFFRIFLFQLNLQLISLLILFTFRLNITSYGLIGYFFFIEFVVFLRKIHKIFYTILMK